MATQGIDYGLSNAPAINTANMQQLQGLLNTALPGYQSGVNQMQRNNMSLLRGNVPTDVQQEVQRFGAQSAITSGIGGGGGAGAAGAPFQLTNKTITARDLGLTSLSLQQQGQQQESNLLQLTKNYLTPQQVNPTSLLPLNELVGAQQWMDTSQFNANMAMYTAAAQFASTQAGTPPAPFGGAGGDISGLIAALTKNYSQSGTSGGSGNSLLGGIFNMFGGGGGSGGMIPSGMSGGGGSTVGDFTGGSSAGASSFGF